MREDINLHQMLSGWDVGLWLKCWLTADWLPAKAWRLLSMEWPGAELGDYEDVLVGPLCGRAGQGTMCLKSDGTLLVPSQ